MMFRRSGQQDDSDLLEARRRLQASMLVGGGDNTGADQQQQLQLYREQQILRDARAAALSGPSSSSGQAQQHFSASNPSSFAYQQHQQHQQVSMMGGPSSSATSMAQQQQQMLQLQQQQLQQEQQLLQLQQEQQQQSIGGHNSFGVVSGGNVGLGMDDASMNMSTARRGSTSNSSYANMLSEQRLAIQRAQLEVQRHAQAQAQAEARVKALLGQEAQVQDQMRLLRQRQLQSPSASTTLSATAYEMLSSPGGRSNNHNNSNTDHHLNQLDSARLGNMNQLGNTNRASLLGLQGAGAATRQQTNSGLPASLGGDEAMIFGKISRDSSDPLADMTLHQPQDLHQHHLKVKEEDRDNAKEATPASSDDEEEEEELDDEDYFKDQAGEPGADGGYPVAREAFPMKLYRILYEAQKNKQDDIISFFPHGRAFAVHKSKEFTRDIMPKYFPAGRMNTFLKQLNLYGFRRITEGRDKGGYFHKDFLKGKRHLCKKIKRKKVHVNKAPPQSASAHAHFQLQNAMVPQLPFLDPLALGNHHHHHSGGLIPGQHQLLQQQQMALGLSGSASNGSLFPSNNALFNASSDLNLSQAYMQDHFQSSVGGAGGASSLLNQSNFNLNFGSANNSTNNMMNGMNPNFR